MKVSELIAKLEQVDQDLEVLCYTEDEDLLPNGHGFRLMDVVGVQVAEGEQVRGDDEIPSLKLGKSPSAIRFATVQVTSDF